MKACVILAGLLLAACAGAAHAGPCTREIDRFQAKIDALIDAEAGAGKAGKESLAATTSRQPTPDSIAKAEAAAGDGTKYEKALGFLQQARESDAAGDAKACKASLKKAKKAAAQS